MLFLKKDFPKDDARKLIIKVLKSSKKELEGYTYEAINLTESYFGKRRVLFNPIYLSNYCLNDCPYCGYRESNQKTIRRILSPDEATIEAKFLNDRGIKNILLLTGEYPQNLDNVLACSAAIKKEANPEWLGVEIAPLSSRGYELLNFSGINSVIVFQETYGLKRYLQLHKKGVPKSNFDYRYNSLKRAIKAGIKEVGLGVLYGIGNWFSDTVNMFIHANELLKYNNNIKLRFSFPRLKPSDFQDQNVQQEEVTEDMLFKAIVGIRLAFPTASLVLSGRESTDFLLRCLSITNIVGKAGSTAVGGYQIFKESPKSEQFALDNDSDFDTFRRRIIDQSYVIS